MSIAQQAADTVTEYVRYYERDWRVIAKDVRFTFYGGIDSPANRAAYVARCLQERRTALTPYLHRTECLALAEALDDVLGAR